MAQEWEPHDVEGERGDAPNDDDVSSKKPDEEQQESDWTCNICFEELRIEQSCLTSCGHLYCWPCLHQWLDTFRQKTTPPVCPVCKNVLTNDKIIPIFGRGTDRATDPRVGANNNNDNVPHRPAPPPREEAPEARGPFNFNFSAGFFGPGIMAFGGNFNAGFGGAARGMPALTVEQRRQQQFLSQIMLFLGFAVLASLLLL